MLFHSLGVGTDGFYLSVKVIAANANWFGYVKSTSQSSSCAFTASYSIHEALSPSTSHPYPFFPLSSLLTSVRRRNLKHALTLANIVADSRYRLYDDFTNQDGRRLGDYLKLVRRGVLAGLEGGGSDPFKVATSSMNSLASL